MYCTSIFFEEKWPKKTNALFIIKNDDTTFKKCLQTSITKLGIRTWHWSGENLYNYTIWRSKACIPPIKRF